MIEALPAPSLDAPFHDAVETPHDEWFDNDGYPSDAVKNDLHRFFGTPHQLLTFVGQLWRPRDTRAEIVDDGVERSMEVTLVTIGERSNEDVIDAPRGTVFEFQNWYMSKRGGLHVYRVPVRNWNRPAFLGSLDLIREWDAVPRSRDEVRARLA